VAAGGTAIPIRVDHSMESEVEALFAQVDREQGRLDVVVNSVAGEDPLAGAYGWFWDADLTNVSKALENSLVSHVITAKHRSKADDARRSGSSSRSPRRRHSAPAGTGETDRQAGTQGLGIGDGH
jgi:enoyl-[acyl-carrier-protein] reductase (NADH)